MEPETTTSPNEEADSQDPGVGSGAGGDLGTPSGLPEEAPPSADQEANAVISGGGVVQPSTQEVDPSSAAGEAKDTVDND